MTRLAAILCAAVIGIPITLSAMPDEAREEAIHALRSAQAAISQGAEHLRVAEGQLADKQREADEAHGREITLAGNISTLTASLLEARGGQLVAERSARRGWLFFSGLSLACVVYVGLRLHPATRLLVP